jgi:radical SAM protein with 4Fe4S-binding SPASM domain
MINRDAFNRALVKVSAAFHPVNATIEITGKCNALCGYCYIREEPRKDDLPLHQLRDVIDKLHEAGVLFLCITGGEPFTRPDIIPFLEYCIKKDFFKISFLTNATLINDDHIAFFKRNRAFFSFVKASVFSHIPEVHDTYTGIPNSLRTTLRNAHKIRECGLTVLLSLNLLDFNCNTFETTMQFFENLGFPVLTGISKLINSESLGKKMRPITGQDFYTRFFNNMPKEKALAFQSGLKNKMANPDTEAGLCTGLYSNIHVGSAGDLSPCISFRKLTIGTIFEKRPLPQILRESELYARVRSQKKTDIPACKQCSYASFCRHCLGLIHSEFEAFDHAPEQYCNFHKALHEIRCPE